MKATPADARAAWEEMAAAGLAPSSRKIAEHLTAEGKVCTHKAVAEWKQHGWKRRPSEAKTSLSTAVVQVAQPAAKAEKPAEACVPANIDEQINTADHAISAPSNEDEEMNTVAIEDVSTRSPTEATRRTALEALAAGEHVFRTIRAMSPAAMLEKPVGLGNIISDMTSAMVAAAAVLVRSGDLAGADAKDVTPGAKPRAKDPLDNAMRDWAKAARQPVTAQ